MAVTPDTTIRLLKVPIEIDNLNQLTFASATAQLNYFQGLTGYIEEEDLSYQRKDNYIMFPYHIDSIIGYNYCMYQNSNYGSKWFYAFITKMEYENDGVTRVYIETDCYQSWMFEMTLKASFVEREHVNDDTIGKHTIPENLNVGEVKQEGTDFTFPALSSAISNYYIAIMSSWVINDNSVKDGGRQFDGVTLYNNSVFGSLINLIHITQASDVGNLLKFVRRTANDGHSADIQSIFVVPSGLIDSATLTTHTAYAGTQQTQELLFTWYTMPYTTTPKTSTATITKPTSYTGLTLKNNKCYTYPYSYLLVSNNAGSHNVLKYEDFSTTTADFELQLALSVGCSGKVVPKNYKGMVYNNDEAIAVAKYPTCRLVK